MSKQDRQGVRTAMDLERKYDFGLLSQTQRTDDTRVTQLVQDLSEYKVATDNELEALRRELEEIDSYTLPIATKETLGGVIVGDEIHVREDGTIWVEHPVVEILKNSDIDKICT